MPSDERACPIASQQGFAELDRPIDPSEFIRRDVAADGRETNKQAKGKEDKREHAGEPLRRSGTPRADRKICSSNHPRIVIQYIKFFAKQPKGSIIRQNWVLGDDLPAQVGILEK